MYKKNYSKDINYDLPIEVDPKKYKYEDDRGRYAITNAFDSINSPLEKNKNRGYTVYFHPQKEDACTRNEYDKVAGLFMDYDQKLIKKGYVPIRPGVRKSVQYPWNWTENRFNIDYKKDLIFKKNKKEEWNIYHKNRSTGLVKDTTIHIIPWNLGGKTNPENLITSCWSCNYGKAGYTLEQLRLDNPKNNKYTNKNWFGLMNYLK